MSLHINIFNIVNKKRNIEVVELSPKGKIFLINNKAAFIQLERIVFPTLLNRSLLAKLPSITVDMGTIPHLCNGADLMAPGIVQIKGVFDRENIIVIIEERYSKEISVAKSLYTSVEVAEKKSGKIAKNLHFVGDSFWQVAKLLSM